MKRRSLSPLLFALAVTWSAGASAAGKSSSRSSLSGGSARGSVASSGATGAIVSGQLRSFTTPAELKANKTLPSGGSGSTNGGPTTNSGSSGAQSQNFGFGRPLKKPVIAKKSGGKAKP